MNKEQNNIAHQALGAAFQVFRVLRAGEKPLVAFHWDTNETSSFVLKQKYLDAAAAAGFTYQEGIWVIALVRNIPKGGATKDDFEVLGVAKLKDTDEPKELGKLLHNETKALHEAGTSFIDSPALVSVAQQFGLIADTVSVNRIPLYEALLNLKHAAQQLYIHLGPNDAILPHLWGALEDFNEVTADLADDIEAYEDEQAQLWSASK